ncbi:MAG: hypothetical protein JXA30_17630, partial [Deltaproteobacteria bacterium]|nr:hypothetical protein [Deltaproteobacteria bacterium]
MKRFIIGLVSLAITAFEVGCTNGEDTGSSGGGSCSALDGTWEGDEIDSSGNSIGSIELEVKGSKIEVTISGSYYEYEQYTLNARCEENTTPHRLNGTITDSSSERAIGQPFYAIYEVNGDTARLAGLKPAAKVYPTDFYAGKGQRLFEGYRIEAENGDLGNDDAEPWPDEDDTNDAPIRGRVKQIALGWSHSCAILEDGTVACWGSNYKGELGNSRYKSSQSKPVLVAGLSGVVQIDLGTHNTCAVLKDKTLECWGDNEFGQVGDGSTTRRDEPTRVVDLSGSVAQVALGDGHTCALLTNGTVQCWGDNEHGQLGDGSTTSSTSPKTVPGLSEVAQIACGDRATCALIKNGTVRCWGLDCGGLGIESDFQIHANPT